MDHPAVAISLTASERQEFESQVRARKTGQAMARRARIVLAAAAGMDNKTICIEVGAEYPPGECRLAALNRGTDLMRHVRGIVAARLSWGDVPGSGVGGSEHGAHSAAFG